MEFVRQYRFAAPVADVWDTLMDHRAIPACLPGCRVMQPVGEDSYEGDVALGVAAITGSFAVRVTLVDQVRPKAYRLLVEANGRPGFARGSAVVVLEPEDRETVVTVTARADIGGLIARVGQRLLESVASTTMDRFFGCLAARVTVDSGPPVP